MCHVTAEKGSIRPNFGRLAGSDPVLGKIWLGGAPSARPLPSPWVCSRPGPSGQAQARGVVAGARSVGAQRRTAPRCAQGPDARGSGPAPAGTAERVSRAAASGEPRESGGCGGWVPPPGWLSRLPSLPPPHGGSSSAPAPAPPRRCVRPYAPRSDVHGMHAPCNQRATLRPPLTAPPSRPPFDLPRCLKRRPAPAWRHGATLAPNSTNRRVQTLHGSASAVMVLSVRNH